MHRRDPWVEGQRCGLEWRGEYIPAKTSLSFPDDGCFHMQIHLLALLRSCVQSGGVRGAKGEVCDLAL